MLQGGLWGSDSSATILLINKDTEESARRIRRRKTRRTEQEDLNEKDNVSSCRETALSWECSCLPSL